MSIFPAFLQPAFIPSTMRQTSSNEGESVASGHRGTCISQTHCHYSTHSFGSLCLMLFFFVVKISTFW